MKSSTKKVYFIHNFISILNNMTELKTKNNLSPHHRFPVAQEFARGRCLLTTGRSSTAQSHRLAAAETSIPDQLCRVAGERGRAPSNFAVANHHHQ
jgi:hypothetical protein